MFDTNEVCCIFWCSNAMYIYIFNIYIEGESKEFSCQSVLIINDFLQVRGDDK